MKGLSAVATTPVGLLPASTPARGNRNQKGGKGAGEDGEDIKPALSHDALAQMAMNVDSDGLAKAMGLLSKLSQQNVLHV